MALKREIARLSKLLVDSEGISFDKAQAWLANLKLEIVVGRGALSPASHAAILTAVSVGRRTFIGGVRVRGFLDQPLNSALPVAASTLGEAVVALGASEYEGTTSRTICVESDNGGMQSWRIAPWWDGWRAGTAEVGAAVSGTADNPLSGIAAGALAVGAAFEAERGREGGASFELNLWPTEQSEQAPSFAEVYLPGALWLIGLGNLGQAFLWALSALPYGDPGAVSLVLQDQDKVTAENWATSVLVRDEEYGLLKTKVGERWGEAKGFDVRRVDRWLLSGDRLGDDDPRIALSGVDKVEVRKLMANVGFDCIVDAGLGRTEANFDRYRLCVFDHAYPINDYFAEITERSPESPSDMGPYGLLEAEIGRCGTAEIAGASIAAPYVSAVAGAAAVSRLIALGSNCVCPKTESTHLSKLKTKFGPLERSQARGMRHAGKPR
jgi:hypothetical protein